MELEKSMYSPGQTWLHLPQRVMNGSIDDTQEEEKEHKADAKVLLAGRDIVDGRHD